MPTGKCMASVGLGWVAAVGLMEGTEQGEAFSGWKASSPHFFFFPSHCPHNVGGFPSPLCCLMALSVPHSLLLQLKKNYSLLLNCHFMLSV